MLLCLLEWTQENKHLLPNTYDLSIHNEGASAGNICKGYSINLSFKLLLEKSQE